MSSTRQEIRFCTARDGTRLAFAKSGQGPAVVKVAHWLSNLEYDWSSPVWQPWLEAWSRFHTLYRYDPRGCGLSDRNAQGFSFESLVSDLETVADAAELEHFDLLGMSQGGSVAIAYAATHPERVRRMVIYGGYARGQLVRASNPAQRDAAELELKLLGLSWGTENPAYRQVLTTLLIPEGSPEQLAWFNELQRASTSAENAVKLQKTFNTVDVQETARAVRAPTLVLHSKQDAAVPFEEGRSTAALIPAARFVPLDSKNHVWLASEPAWATLWQEYYAFMGIEGAPAIRPEPGLAETMLSELSPREREILQLLARGDRNADIARKLVLSEKTVRNHISTIYSKLQVTSRGEAIVLARKSGIVSDKP
jgi:pimeloyl-ACP methyl ester carboxylesterase/DNA-binding CsgD family transcriptional regulator